MDPAVFLLVVFLVYSILLGICIASVRGMRRELDGITRIIQLLGVHQQADATPMAAPMSAQDVSQLVTPELLAQVMGRNDG